MQKHLEAFQSEARTMEISTAVSEKLSPKKYEHSLNVARYAWLLAEKTSVDPEKMYIAGLLHDVANELSKEEILQLCKRTDRYIPVDELRHARLLHGIAGACIAYEEFGIRDREILMAIAYHSGRVGMHDEEKILFLADMIDHSCLNGYDPARIWKQKDLDSAILAASTDMIDFCIQYNLPMGQRTQDSFDYILEQLQNKTASGVSSYNNHWDAADEIVDKSMDIYLSHRLKMNSVKNIRDAGNYSTISGKTIKKNKIIRSGDLSQLTAEDAEQLLKLGINTIIDLRSSEEINVAKDRNIEAFRYFNFPLPKLETKDSAERLLDFLKSSISETEKVWYATEFMRYANMKQLYHDVLTSDNSAEQFRNVFDILLDIETKSVLIHCSNGKDRTGIAVMLIQFALGMRKEDILNDYYASALPYYMITESAVLLLEQNGSSSEFLEKARELLGIGANMIEDLSLWWKENQFGTPEEYLRKKLLISTEQMELLRGIYLES